MCWTPYRSPALVAAVKKDKNNEGVWRLTVEVSENQSDKHREAIQAIYNARMQDLHDIP